MCFMGFHEVGLDLLELRHGWDGTKLEASLVTYILNHLDIFNSLSNDTLQAYSIIYIYDMYIYGTSSQNMIELNSRIRRTNSPRLIRKETHCILN